MFFFYRRFRQLTTLHKRFIVRVFEQILSNLFKRHIYL